ncbi:MAG: NAD-dependent epimerase/dehydratase family protein [Actinomycetota bacterium]|nr:NAD-dependent epimerase/dehydratase family protein [Actinomycetota bacterium]
MPRAFLTGGTGFIGSRLAHALTQSGWDVVALVRSVDNAKHLESVGVRLAIGDITQPHTLDEPLYGCDAVFHLAAMLKFGVADRHGMVRVNVHGTRNVLEAASAAAVSRVVYCSTIGVLGRGEPSEVRDETSVHPDYFPSAYEETKWEAHQLVRKKIADGMPAVVVLPGVVYGPGETGLLSRLIGMYARGWLLAMPRMDWAASYVHVDDVVRGILQAFEKGRVGEEYVLGGDNATLRELFDRLAPIAGVRPPRFQIAEKLLPLARPFGPIIARALGQPPRFVQEGLDSLHGSYMASSAKAERELGYHFRALEDGMGEVLRWAKEH